MTKDPRIVVRIVSDAVLCTISYIVLTSVSGFLSDALIVQRSIKLDILSHDFQRMCHLGYVFWWVTHYDKFTIAALFLWVVMIGFMVWLFYGSTRDSRKKYRHRADYASNGTSRWQENWEVNQHYFQDSKGILLGAYHHKQTDEAIKFEPLPPEAFAPNAKWKHPYAIHPFSSRLNQNYIVFAPPGFGKTTTLGIPNILHAASQGTNLVVTDPKGEIYEYTADFLTKQGYEIVVLDHLDFEFGNRFNPLDYITRPDQYMEIAHMYLTATKKPDQQGGDQFWEESAQGLFAALIGLVKEGFNGSLPDVQRLTSKVTNPHAMLSLFQRFNVQGTALALLQDFLAVLDSEKTAASIVAHLKTKLQLYTLPRVIAHSKTTDFNLRDIANKKMAIYLRIADDHGTYGPITSVFWSILYHVLYEEARKAGGGLPIPILLVQDEMANIGTIPDLTRKLTTMRSRNIFSMMIWHDYPQLEDKYGVRPAATIMGSCATKILIAAGNIETANKFSEMIGDTTIETQSRRENSFLGPSSNGNQTSSFTGRRLMQPSELTSMDLPFTLVLQTSRPPVQLNKVLYDTRNPSLPKVRFEDLPHYEPASGVSFIDQLFASEPEILNQPNKEQDSEQIDADSESGSDTKPDTGQLFEKSFAGREEYM